MEDICNSKLHQYLINLISKSIDSSCINNKESIEIIITPLVNQLVTESTELYKKDNSIDLITDSHRKTLNENIRRMGIAAAKSFKADPQEFQK
jgi:hypothetical protein